jgi:hypothetical protein
MISEHIWPWRIDPLSGPEITPLLAQPVERQINPSFPFRHGDRR